jgi:apolipoprotein N-acyltransferase
MNATGPEKPRRPLPRILFLSVLGVTAFHLALLYPVLGPLVLFFVAAMVSLSQMLSPRAGFYMGLGMGLAIYAPHLSFFWTIFGVGAVALWLVLAFWLGFFVAGGAWAGRRFSRPWLMGLLPFLWLALEYFRSELYYLRFSWLTPGFVFASSPAFSHLAWLGVYGIGFLFALIASLTLLIRDPRRQFAALAAAAFVLFLIGLAPASHRPAAERSVVVAGVQLEFPDDNQVLRALEKARQQAPAAGLFVLGEYTFQDVIPREVKEWCRDNKRHLIAGGKLAAADNQFFNTAFVVGPDGEIEFDQAKSVPIQMMSDGLPAVSQKVWNSPWGRIGIAICYDLSYRRVIDRLVENGAEALVIPTMDVYEWGARQHELHAHVAPMRSMEYGLPIFRVCSSGISQLLDDNGCLKASAPFPGDNEVLSGRLEFRGPVSLPIDHHLGPVSIVVSSAALVLALARGRFGRKKTISDHTP